MSLEQTIDNLQIRNANMVTFVGTSNTMVDTTTGRIQTKGIQHNSNVITDVSGPHGRGVATLKKYPEIIFEEGKFDRNDTTNTYTQAGYTVTANATHENRNHEPWVIFNDNFTADDEWQISTNLGGDRYSETDGTYNSGVNLAGSTVADQTYNGDWVQVSLPQKIKLARMNLGTGVDYGDSRMPEEGVLLGSNNGTTWSNVLAFGQTSYQHSVFTKIDVNSSDYYSYYRMIWLKITAGNDSTHRNRASLALWELYGYEEDPPAGDHSVDTTFKSRFNNPQTTGVQVLVDGATGVGTNQISGGPDPSGNQSTYVTDGKYWTLNGTLTSNLSVEANTFLEGDQPHAVSVWFNSSNLEANVSNTCVFSIASEEKLDSVNLDLQSNTWHNLTYAYQGEGGSRVTYLDGRKVAEDQAEDTFGEYPPFNMTVYSQGGYVVSASSEHSSPYLAHEAFNGTFAENGDAWLCASSVYNSSTGTYNGNANLGSDSGGPAFANADKGEWLKLEMPDKFVLDYITICGSTATGVNPKDWKIYGSNDDKNWDVLLSKTNAITAAYNASSDNKEHVVGASKAYKYFALVVTKSGGLSGNHYIQVSELEFYGHRENDLVRLPDPTNVLKYPHIIINEPAKRGYVVSSSTEAVPPNTTGSYQAYNIFDGETVFDGGTSNTPPNGTTWISRSSKYDGSGNPTGTAASTNVTGQSPVATPGEWFQLELPHKVKLSSIRVMGQTNNTTELTGRSPVDAVLAGSNNGTAWTTVLTYTGASWTTLSEFKSFPANVDSTNAYKYFRFIITKTGGDQYAAIQEFEFYGTGVDSIPIQIGGGNIDKVANFRVYDKFIEEDQALEIWNAQKEEFGRAKPQMVLQQGKLGIGTDAPQGSLSVADEPHNLEEFPPRAMTSSETYIEGHGVFKASASYTYPDANYGPSAPWRVFSKDVESQTTGWISSNDHNAVTGSNPGEYNGTNQLTSSTPLGEWLKIELPHKIKLNSYALKTWGIANRYGVADYPKTFYIYGSNDGSSWELIDSRVNTTKTPRILGAAVASYETINYSVSQNALTYYDKYAIVITKINSEAVYAVDNTVAALYVALGEWRLFGTREQDQSVLHDGQLTLTKSLTVPRIGPALDADDTPRRDRLIVEYNTSTNPTFEGAVRDTSGRGNDGIMIGSSYSATDKALSLTNSPTGTSSAATSYITRQGLGNTESGNFNHSVSLWFKLSSAPSSVWRAIFEIGPHPRTNTKDIGLYVTSTANNWLGFASGGSTLYGGGASTGVEVGTYYHIVIVYDGAKKYIYVDGTLSNSHSYTSFNGAKNMTLQIGRNNATALNEGIDGSISNFKMYVGHALTAQEVKTLYDMGRNGSVANPQPLHIAAPLYAPGVPVQIVSKVYKKQVAYGSTNSDRNIKELDISIKPKFPNSRILLHWMINGELHQDNVIRVARDGSYIIHGYNETQGTNQWSGIAAGAYDLNEDTTPENYCIDTYDEPGGTNTYNYQIYIGSSSTGSYPVYINRTYASLGADYKEAGICFMSATEIAQ
jgi:hypothetical protein